MAAKENQAGASAHTSETKRGKPKAPRRGKTDSPVPAQTAARSLAGVVGLVGSAGSLHAFKDFFDAMPCDSGLAFLLVPHLDPAHESLIASLIAKHTAMPVVEAAEGQRLEPDHLYVIPPDRALMLQDSTIRLTPLPASGPGRIAIDPFLGALADDQQEHAICVVLSGTGAHGSLGLETVKAAGGMVMVQDPASAEHASMPLNAVETGLADYVLPPRQMPQALLDYLRHFEASIAAQPEPASAQDELAQIVALLRAETQFDFQAYRKRMLMRRVQRRVALHHLRSLSEYLVLLREHPEERAQLDRDLLIGVTQFFRDPEMFRILETQVIPSLIGQHAGDTPLRAWVPACASGEEAYSIAMVLIEGVAAAGKQCTVQVFATDVDEGRLKLARRGIYSDAALKDVSRERLERFFTRIAADTWQVSKLLREAILFAPQNVLSDAPFSKMDLVSCRNLLIYLEPDAQKALLRLFHFSLNPGGCLVLGPSENVGRQSALFLPISRKWRIFERIGTHQPVRAGFPIVAGGRAADAITLPPRQARDSLAELARRTLLDSYAPAAVVIDSRSEVLLYSGPTHLYLQQPGGLPSQDLMRLVDAGLRPRLRAALQQASLSGEHVEEGGIRIRRNRKSVPVRLAVQPLEGKGLEQGLMLVVFQDEPEAPQSGEGRRAAPAHGEEIQALERELESTRGELQSSIEDLASNNEELLASNEEVMSMNEELQSANEELETSKEELQSLNEELATVNAQLREKVDELEAANDDMTNLLVSSEVATLFLGLDGTIERFTPSATRLFNLIDSDVGRPIGDITSRFERPELLADIATVAQQRVAREWEVCDHAGSWYLLRVTPYRTAQDRIEGVVLTFSDITRIKHAEASLREGEQRFRALVAAASDVVYRMNPDWTEMRQLVGRDFISDTDEANHSWVKKYILPDERPRVLEDVASAISGKRVFELEHQARRLDGSLAWVFSRAVPILDAGGEIIEWVGMAQDVTTRRAAEAERERLLAEVQAERDRISALVASMEDEVWFVDADRRLTLPNPAACREFGLVEGETADVESLAGALEILRPDGSPRPVEETPSLRALQGETIVNQLEIIRTPGSGELRHRQVNATPVRDRAGRIIGAVTVVRDITELKRAELGLKALTESLEQKVAERTENLEMEIAQRREAEIALRASEERLRTVFERAPIGIAQADPADGCLLSVNPAFCAIVRYEESELLGRPIADVTYPEDREADREGFRRLVAGEIDIYAREKRYIRKDGKIIWAGVSVSLVRDADGRPLHTVAMIADISERKRLQQELANYADELQREGSFMDAVLDTQATLVLVVDAEGRLARFNRACEHTTGYDFAELQGGAGWWQLVPAEERAAIEEQVLRVLEAGGEMVEHENHLLTKDGARRLIYWRNTALRDPAGRVEYVVGTGIDVTDQRDAEQTARMHLEEMAGLQRLQTANELAGMLAHELNQPLATIVTDADAATRMLAQETPDADKLAGALARIGRQGMRAGDIIRNLRAYVSRNHVDPRPLHLNAVARSACALWQPKARAQGIRIDLHLDEALPQVLGVDVQIEQVLVNLIGNACDAIGEAGVQDGKITIRTRRAEDMAMVTVRDNGPGFDEIAARSMFEGLASTKPHGLGIGLRISRSLVEKMNGRLWAEANPPDGRGGCFHFALPLASHD